MISTISPFAPRIAAPPVPARAERGLRCPCTGSEPMYSPAEIVERSPKRKPDGSGHRRFSVPFCFGDFAGSTISLPVILADRETTVVRDVVAAATHDGYFLAAVPIGDCRYSAALQFGVLFEWLQVGGIAFVPADVFLADGRRAAERGIPAEPLLEDMEQVAPCLFRCDGDTGFMMVHPPRPESGRAMLLTAVFRPLVDPMDALSPLATPAAARA